MPCAVCTGGGSLVYVYRPVLLPGCSGRGDACVDLGTGEPLQLPGFGVELALKNMEYSALDDSKVSRQRCLFWLRWCVFGLYHSCSNRKNAAHKFLHGWLPRCCMSRKRCCMQHPY